jgi:hypothetical protein
MRQILYKFTLLLLLPAFLAGSVGDAFGYAWCFGDDGHSEIEYITVNGCGDEDAKENGISNYNVPTLHPAAIEHCGPCLDVSMQTSEAVFFKQLEKVPPVAINFVSTDVFSFRFVPIIQLVAGNRAAQPPPRISQTILAHRTIVLQT